jgi:hypothetical protein
MRKGGVDNFNDRQKSMVFFTSPSSEDVFEGNTTTERKTEPKFIVIVIVKIRPRHIRKA